MNTIELFEKWYIVPLMCLKSVPDNNGSFIALATALFLYERYVVAQIKIMNEKATKNKKVEQIVSDFDVDKRTASLFWDVMRDGILHQGMPKQHEQGGKLPAWRFDHSQTSHPIKLLNINGEELLMVQPWKVVDKVITLWRENSELLNKNTSFPWAHVFAVKSTAGEKTNGDFFLVTGSSSGLGLNDYERMLK